jgi:hypothetical protein
VTSHPVAAPASRRTAIKAPTTVPRGALRSHGGAGVPTATAPCSSSRAGSKSVRGVNLYCSATGHSPSASVDCSGSAAGRESGKPGSSRVATLTQFPLPPREKPGWQTDYRVEASRTSKERVKVRRERNPVSRIRRRTCPPQAPSPKGRSAMRPSLSNRLARVERERLILAEFSHRLGSLLGSPTSRGLSTMSRAKALALTGPPPRHAPTALASARAAESTRTPADVTPGARCDAASASLGARAMSSRHRQRHCHAKSPNRE